MRNCNHCQPKEMVRFLLAFCCQDGEPLDDGEALDERFDDCWRKVIPIANSEPLTKRLKE